MAVDQTDIKPSSYGERRHKIRLIQAALLVLAALIAGYFLQNYLRNKTLPLPDINEATSGFMATPEYLYSIDGGTGPGMLRRPLGLTISPDGNLFVTDSDNSRVSVFNLTGDRIFDISAAGKKKLLTPLYVAVAPNGEIYVTDRGLRTVAVYDSLGKFERFLYPNGNPAAIWLPIAIAIDKKGDLYISEVSQDHRILKMSPTGKIKMSIGIIGEAVKSTDMLGKVFYPNGIRITDKGDIYVSDSNNRRVQVFTAKGNLKKVILTGGMPRGIALDSKGRLFIVDTFGHNVMAYDNKGRNVGFFGERGVNYGQFQYPNDIDISSDNRLFVTDRENNRVQVWGERPELPGLAKPIAGAVVKWGWLFLPPLIALYLFRKRNIFVASPAFINRLIEDGLLEETANRIGHIYVTPEAYQSFFGRKVGNIELATFLREKPYFDDLVSEFERDYHLPTEAARMLSAMKRGANRKTLLVGDSRPTAVLEELGIKNIPYSEFVAKVLGR